MLQQKIEEAITAAVEERTRAVIADVTEKSIEAVRMRIQAEATNIATRVRSKLESRYNFDTAGLKIFIQIQIGGDR